MKRTTNKYYIGISIMILLSALKNYYFNSDLKLDVYLFYNHSRYIDNILYDISNMFKFSIMSYWLISISRKTFTPVFIVSILYWILYFTLYSSLIGLIIIPIYLLLTFIYNFKRKSKKTNEKNGNIRTNISYNFDISSPTS